MSYSIKYHLKYNYWANTRLAEAIKQLTDEQLDRELVSSFPSVRKTLYHLWDAELIWLKRIQGEALSTWPSSEFNGSTQDMLSLFVGNSKELAEFIEGKEEDFLNGTLTYKNMKGDEFTNRIEDMLFHVVNHGSFHRGQIITLLRQLGLTKFQSMDLITYMRQ